MGREKHPSGLYVLFFTEMWERFSFYTMAAVFMYYLRWDHWKEAGYPWLGQYASLINGLYIGTVYFSPFIGGILADRKIGYFWSIIYGAIFLGLGLFLLSVQNVAFIFLGLLGMVIGNGLFKPNISTLVGKLYAPNDPRLDGAYTIFYMGINIGAFLAPLAAGFLRVHLGFHAAYMAAGAGMGVSVLIFVACRRWLVFTDYRQASTQVHPEEDVPPNVQRNRHVALLIIFVVVALFWMAFKQNAITVPLWFKDYTDRSASAATPTGLLDKEGKITAEYNALINPFYVIVFSPVMVLVWGWLRKRGLEPPTPAKVALGMVFAALGFALLAVGGLDGGDAVAAQRRLDEAAGLSPDKVAGLVSPGYLLGAYVFITLGELCLSPMGLSLVSKLAAPRSRSAWMGGWFAATAAGGYLAGAFGQLWEVWRPSVFWGVLVASSLAAALILLVCYGRLRRAMLPPKLAVAERTEAKKSLASASG